MMPFLKIGQNSLYANYRVAKILVDYPRINNGSKYIKSTKYSIEKKKHATRASRLRESTNLKN